MTVVTAPTQDMSARRHYHNAAEWVHSLGDIPLERIVFDPLPGTATEADLLRLAEAGDRLCELIDGTLVEKPMGLMEAIIAMNLVAALAPYAQKMNAVLTGPDGTLRMRNGRVRLPDVSYILLSRLPGGVVPAESIPSFAPDLAVEVLSPSNTEAEIQQKLREYFDSGTRLAWIIDPATRTVAVYHKPGEPTRVLPCEGQLDGEDVVPGFALPVSELFRNVPTSASK